MEENLLEKMYPEANAKQEYIICAAIWFDDGKKYNHQPKNISSGVVVCGRRHHNCYLTASINRAEKCSKSVQGFLTSKDVFVDRKEAGELAFKANQITEPTDCLFSEDLY